MSRQEKVWIKSGEKQGLSEWYGNIHIWFSVSQCEGQVSVYLLIDSIFQVQVLGVKRNSPSTPHPHPHPILRAGWNHWVLHMCNLPHVLSCWWRYYSVILWSLQQQFPLWTMTFCWGASLGGCLAQKNPLFGVRYSFWTPYPHLTG